MGRFDALFQQEQPQQPAQAPQAQAPQATPQAAGGRFGPLFQQAQQAPAPAPAAPPQAGPQGIQNELILSGDLPSLPGQGPEGIPISQAPEPPGTIQRTLGGIAETGFRGLQTGAAATARGLTSVADLPANLINFAAQQAGGQGVVPTIGGTQFGQQATASPVPEEERTLPITAIEKAAEFYGGGLGLAKLFSAVANKNPAVLQTTKGQAIAQDLARFNVPVERAAAIGAGTGGAIAEEISDNPLVTMAFELGGGLSAASSAAFRQQGPTAIRRAGAQAQERVANRTQALKNIQDARAGVAGVEASQDQGIMSLYQDIIRTDHSLEQKYQNYLKESADVMKREVEEQLGPSVPVEEGVMQDFVARHRDDLIGMIDLRVAQAEQIIKEAVSMQGRKSNPVEQSKILDREVNAAISDIDNQNKILWGLVDADKITAVPVNRLRQEAEQIVSDFPKTAQPSKELLKQLETVLGRRIQKTEAGFVVSNKPTREARFLSEEPVNEIIKARSEWEALKRSAQAGEVGTSRDAVPFIRLSEAALDTLDNVQGAGEAYNTARAFTRRYKELVEQGRLGAVNRRTAQGDTRVPPELTGQRLFGADPASAAAGARETTELAELAGRAREAQALNLPQSPGVSEAASDFILTQFQRKAEEGADAAARWARDHETALTFFPRMRQLVDDTVATLARQEDQLSVLGSERDKIEKDAFFKVANMSGKKAVSYLLDGPSPSTRVDDFIARLQQGKSLKEPTDAMLGFKKAVAEYALERFTTKSGNTSFSGANDVMKRLKPIINSKAYTKEQREAMSTVLRELENRARVAIEGRTGVPLKNNVIADLGGRMLGSKLATIAGGGASIILAGVGARTGAGITNRLSNQGMESILARAMMDKELLKKLLAIDTSKANARAEAAKVIGSINAAAAQEIQQ